MMENTGKKARDCLIKILYPFYRLRDVRLSGESKVLEIDKFRRHAGFKKQLYGIANDKIVLKCSKLRYAWW